MQIETEEAKKKLKQLQDALKSTSEEGLADAQQAITEVREEYDSLMSALSALKTEAKDTGACNA